MEHLIPLLDTLWSEGMPLRLVGVALSDYDERPDEEGQLPLFDTDEITGEDESLRKLIRATDAVRKRFGDAAVSYGKELRTNANTTGSSAKNPEDYK